MPRGVKKENLPSKVCTVCNRPFTWRKKWEKVWDEVTTCSKSCNRKRKELRQMELRAERTTPQSSVEESFNSIDEVESNSVFFERQRPSSPNTSSDPKSDSGSFQWSPDEKDIMDAIAFADVSGVDSQDSVTNVVINEEEELDPVAQRKAQRKAAKKAAKAARRAQREGRGDPTAGNKPCDMCDKRVDLLIRCTYDESGVWKMVCGKCWKEASGGVVDGDADHPHYRYGGLWKNRRRK
eukprot:CAMPEP_0113564578 /NCGR_PEP_ID=MMETSP0015_2-20120614/21698_1 /TAXON_ID=2838 /ORGANISM="Odontella" /LENGTH=237 /DNA_ID=CAMNT_0000466677 /DNA_START=380 /DNA_END=1093 /DNA_ORIENTATION=- /assembly_acc=CAM_ASM_000160